MKCHVQFSVRNEQTYEQEATPKLLDRRDSLISPAGWLATEEIQEGRAG